ncbi:Taurine import ATP-binding protein TauB [Rhodobacteraceae bacterium THAF1]|uniref:ATP-binding cassette domain-containing protein n=1 Tax=Palleronia sp. THAF1 TaxID=2587842 RepID=UPI000F41E311|nr:ATP-binding cassette domain-containing protein [Palleronia sp. THAF1]QFU09118.1 Taurine import ATP-binding protein TauB [Palleronia sp. THAF1]VDC24074.1 Taurine import ATP-binding protein TauB [Rhodobacteraceae bacterium THAF1]
MPDPAEKARPILSVALDGLRYDGTDVLANVAFDLAPGETVALVGPSGIGKTTLLRCIAGLETGYRGRIDARGTTSVIFQEPTLLPWRTCLQNLTIPTGIGRDGALDLLDSVGLMGRGQAFPLQLSLGQQRRLALARAFAARPSLLLMDEPFVSLDPVLVDEMMTLFTRLKHETGVATLLVTHVEAEAERLATRVITLGGPPARIASDRRNAPKLGEIASR